MTLLSANQNAYIFRANDNIIYFFELILPQLVMLFGMLVSDTVKLILKV